MPKKPTPAVQTFEYPEIGLSIMAESKEAADNRAQEIEESR